MATIEEFYKKAMEADKAFSEELTRLFGNEAGDARYDRRGKSTPELIALGDAKVAADLALHNAMRERRDDASL